MITSCGSCEWQQSNYHVVSVSHHLVLMSVCVFLSVCSASGSAEVKAENMSEEEDREEVFTVELHRGPHGLGLALVDGTVR